MPLLYRHVLPFQQDFQILVRDGLRQGKLSQQLLYAGEGAERFFSSANRVQRFNGKRPGSQAMTDFLGTTLSGRQGRIALISIGCGDASKEAAVIETLGDQYQIDVIGIESASAMLSRAALSLEERPGSHQLIQADAFDPETAAYVSDLTASYDHRIIAMLGATMGNMSQDVLFEGFRALTRSGDLLWFDCIRRMSATSSDDEDITRRYASRLEDPEWLRHPLTLLEIIKLPFEQGHPVMNTQHEPDWGALRFTYGFELNQSVDLQWAGATISLPRGSVLELLDIRAFLPRFLAQAMEQSGFELSQQHLYGLNGYFIFRRI